MLGISNSPEKKDSHTCPELLWTTTYSRSVFSLQFLKQHKSRVPRIKTRISKPKVFLAPSFHLSGQITFPSLSSPVELLKRCCNRSLNSWDIHFLQTIYRPSKRKSPADQRRTARHETDERMTLRRRHMPTRTLRFETRHLFIEDLARLSIYYQ